MLLDSPLGKKVTCTRVGPSAQSNRADLTRFQVVFDDGSTTHEWIPGSALHKSDAAPLLIAGERERVSATRDQRKPRIAVKAARVREILGG